MSEKQGSEKEGKSRSWLKTIIGAAAGLLSGAVMMYASPLLDKVIKPSKPVANFAVAYDSLTVTFHNRSTGGNEGWWDFGDGSPLEPLDAKQEVVSHTYPSPGEYTAKLSLRNLLGDESERTAKVAIETVKSAVPSIEAIEAVPLNPNAYAPATFRVKCAVKNAQICVWDLGEDRNLEFSTDGCTMQDRLVTFNKPGGYVIKLAAVNGNQAKERSEIVYVNEPPTGTLAAILHVTEQATKVETLTTNFTFEDAFPPNATGKSHRIDRQALARPGYEIVDVRLQTAQGQGAGMKGNWVIGVEAGFSGKGAQNLRLELAKDRRSVRLTGELVKDSGLGRDKAAPKVVFPVVLVQERRTPATRPAVPVTATLPVPGSAFLALPPLPENWRDPQRQLRLELRDGDRILWQESQLPRGAAVTVRNRSCLLTATQVGDQVRVDLVEARPGARASLN